MPDTYAINPGDKVPAKLPLALSSGETAKLGDYTLGDGRGHWLLLYFYPKDSPPGCTTAGIHFNALLPQLRQLRQNVPGLSRASIRLPQTFYATPRIPLDLITPPHQS